MLDGNAATAYQLPLAAGSSTEIGLSYDEPKEVGRIVVKWAVGYFDSYDVEYSEDGENWYLLTQYADDEHTVVNGAGSIDVIEVDKSEKILASYLRITPVKKGTALMSPAVYAFDVYEPDDFVPLVEDETPPPEYDEEDEDDFYDDFEDDEEIPDDDENEEDEDEDDEDDEKTQSSSKKKRKLLIYPGFPYWIVIVGGVVLIAFVVLLILGLKKKQAQKAAEENPTDFPENPAEQ